MKNTMVRLLALLCAAMMFLLCFSGCKNNGKGNDTGVISGDATLDGNEGPGGATDEKSALYPTRKDLDDYTYRMVVDGGLDMRYFGPVDDLKGDAVNIAYYNRNKLLESFFNINFEISNLGAAQYQMADELNVSVMGNFDFADTIYAVAGHIMSPAISNGQALDLNLINGLNLDASYWDQRIQKEYSIDGKLFTLEGDYTIYDEMRTHVVAYNKQLYTNYGYMEDYGTPYEMVRSGKWTLETMVAMSKDKSDLNNGESLTMSSQWGIISESPFPYIVYLGTGNKIIEVQDDGALSIAFEDDSHFNRTSEILRYCAEKLILNQEVLFTDKSNGVLDDSAMWAQSQGMFKSNQALFRTSTLKDVMAYSDMVAEFGILPAPKYSVEQKEYYSWCASLAHTPLMIPATAKGHIDTTVAITEAMAYFSKYISGGQQSLVEAFYENMTVNKLCRSQDDYEMLELIFANKTFDIETALGMWTALSVITEFCGTRDISTLDSRLQSQRESAGGKLETILLSMYEKLQ